MGGLPLGAAVEWAGDFRGEDCGLFSQLAAWFPGSVTRFQAVPVDLHAPLGPGLVALPASGSSADQIKDALIHDSSFAFRVAQH
jgi:hypothetical protein